jgi:hypothetical protein
VKLVEVDPDGMVTEGPDTDRSELLLDTDTVVPPAGAGLLSATVQVVVPRDSKLVGLHVNELRATDSTRLTVAVWEIPAGTTTEA